MEKSKQAVHDFWNTSSCGESLYLDNISKDNFQEQAKVRYQLEPYIVDFADFNQYKDKNVLEIGVGLGADHEMFAIAGAKLTGIDLTERAVRFTQQRFSLFGLTTELKVADAESLPFDDNSFDLVYSWGVLHHSPDTQKAISGVYRVLKPGGTAKIMIYHKWSIIGAMLWIRYGLLKLNPFIKLETLYSRYLESPGTKAYTEKEARALFRSYNKVDIETVLTHGDLLTSSAGQKHQGMLLCIARIIWPRWLIRRLFPKNGLFMLITAVK